MFSSLLIVCLFSGTLATVDIIEEGIRLPSVNPGDLPAVASPAKPETLFDKLVSPFALLQGGFPCLGASSLKSGKCLGFDACVADGGFGDGKGLCLGGGSDVVCCVKPVVCGEISLLNNTVLANPGFPASTNQGGSCSVKLVKPFGISHIKLVIHDLELARPDEVTCKCDVDSFSVSGGLAPGFNLGKICGLNAKTHLYIPTLIDLTDVFINVELGSDTSIKRRWLIRAEFIEAKSSFAPPKGCVQYFQEEAGLITSLNFDQNSMVGLGNIDSLKYSICIEAASESCSIEFDSVFFNLGGNITSHALPFSDEISAKLFRSIAPEAVSIESRAVRPYSVRPYAATRYGYHRPSPVVYPTGYLSGSAYPAPGYQPTYQMVKPVSQYYRPAYHRPSYYTPSRYPVSEFLYQVPSHMRPYMYRPLSVLHHPSVYSSYSTMYNAPMKKPGVDNDKLELLEDKLGKLDNKFGDKLDKVEDLLGVGESFKADGLNKLKVCVEQDALVFPIPDDGTSPIHCGNDLHFGKTLVSSNSPFVIKVSNKGSTHGKGFALTYKLKC